MTKREYRIIFLGTSIFALPILNALIKSNYKPLVIITEPDRPKGRGQKLTPPPVKILSQKYNIPLWQPLKIGRLKKEIKNLNPDIGVVTAYGQIIPKEILSIPRYGFLNIHPSLLPKYRGASPIQTTILNGDKETGVTIIKMDEQIDHGPIIKNIKFQITNPKITYPELSNKLANIGANLLLNTLPQYLSGKIKPIKQDHSQASYTQLLKKSDGLIDWKKKPEEIERQIRAFTPWPGCYTIINQKRFKICQAHLDYGKLIIDRIQPEGKKEMSFQEFAHGYPKELTFFENQL